MLSGFHLSAAVHPPHNLNPAVGQGGKSSYNVAVVFDRRRISSCSCSCNTTASWCCHIVALCLFRIHQVSVADDWCFSLYDHFLLLSLSLLPLSASFYTCPRCWARKREVMLSVCRYVLILFDILYKKDTFSWYRTEDVLTTVQLQKTEDIQNVIICLCKHLDICFVVIRHLRV